ncbi:hypothetical protein THTE_0288 [Thermogutta terrifontis]|jgi:hypothetical protein|uniref:Uncharacterized protein n=1 Tax=Thermogutta terrifontis TaxID=1331910 RepID=A0A286RAB7_9BACT|nr:hypothetical protein THTE_0288 [Thermogutta terrifontis]
MARKPETTRRRKRQTHVSDAGLGWLPKVFKKLWNAWMQFAATEYDATTRTSLSLV